MKIYNSLTRRIEEFKQLQEGVVTMYVCGPTVYNEMHIGNSRPMVFFDVVKRFLIYKGNKVKLVSNFTDIDDKIIKKAKDEGSTEEEVADRYIKIILETYKMLNCLPYDLTPRVTETMPQIINYISRLIDKKGAYQVDKDVYFSIESAPEYGVLSGQSVDNLIAGSRVNENNKKRSPLDFNLWKETDEGKKWDSPWGKGRPGWHTECVVMIEDNFGGKIDIHGGGLDLKFPHHENEIAQSCVVSNHKIASYWMHNGRIDLNGEKMSKSLGNVIWAKELVSKIGYGPYRMVLLSVPYRQPMNFSDEMLEQAAKDFNKIISPKIKLIRKLEIDFDIKDYQTKIIGEEQKQIKQQFIDALDNDFNTSNAITVIFNLTKKINQIIRSKDMDVQNAKEYLSLLDEFMWVLGIDTVIPNLNKGELDIIRKWNKARNDKDYQLADELRKEISKRGISI